MEKETLKLIMDSIGNDHCKMLCVLAMNEKNPKMRAYYRRKIFIYCIIYDAEIFVKKLYEVHEQNKLNYKDDDIDFAYLYYLSCKETNTDNLKMNIINRYNRQKVQNSILKHIKYQIKLIEKTGNKNMNINIKNNSIVSYRATIVNMCMKYVILSNEFKLKKNSQIDKIMKENIEKIIEQDKIYA